MHIRNLFLWLIIISIPLGLLTWLFVSWSFWGGCGALIALLILGVCALELGEIEAKKAEAKQSAK
jgi:hypothetical protein